MMMSAIDELKKKHLQAYEELVKQSSPVINKIGICRACDLISIELNMSHLTIINYVKGKAKDGFLTEVITKEFEKLQKRSLENLVIRKSSLRIIPLKKEMDIRIQIKRGFIKTA